MSTQQRQTNTTIGSLGPTSAPRGELFGVPAGTTSAAAGYEPNRKGSFRLKFRQLARFGFVATLATWLLGLDPAQAAAPPPPGSPHVFFVSPNGNDRWTGHLDAPNAAGTDGPFATLARARDALRELKRQEGGVLKESPTVSVRGGNYFLTEPLAFLPEDSGTAQSPVMIAAFPGEKPVVSGGRRLEGWKPATANGRQLWAVEIPEVRDGKWFFRQLWVNGERRARARHPNQGYLAVESIPDAKPGGSWTEGQSRFRFKAGDLKAWPTINNAEVRVMNRWVESHLPVMQVNETERLVMFSKRSVFSLEPGDLYYLEHALELLDQPGEWYLDRAAGRLYYWPMPGEDMTRAEVIAPVLAQVVRLDGQPETGRFIDHLIFRGLAFAHTEWYFPGGFDTGREKAEVWPPPRVEVGGFAQAAVGVPGAVRGHGVRNVKFEGCSFIHLGDYALELARGCQNNLISRCELADLGAGGIKLGETAIRNTDAEVSRDNEVSDCHIHDGGLIFHSAHGVWVGQSPGNKLLHNHIHDFYYSGISFGWTWGYGRALATNSLVEWNHVHHIGVRSDGDGPILSDMAGIYTLGLHLGSVIRNNLWHDTAGLRYGGWGIYFDEGTQGILAENNVVYRTTHGGFHQHYGRDNVVQNNVFAYARDWQIQRTRAEAHQSYTFAHNIVLWNRGRLLEGNFSGTVSNYLFHSNLYWREGGGDVKFSQWSFEAWQQKGQDTNSLIANPKFVNLAKDDFTLAPDSPAFKLGVRPIDLKGVGPRPPRPGGP
jgi:hypothetical protein